MISLSPSQFEKTKPISKQKRAKTLSLLQKSAKNYLKQKRVTLLIASDDLEQIKILASNAGLDYQTYIANILHKLSLGLLKDIHHK